MNSLDTETIPEEPSVLSRLRSVKNSIQKATQEALKRSSDDPSTSILENDDPNANASFHLGMELFGQETSVVERTVQEKLNQVENELEDLLETAQQEEGDEQHETQEAAALESSSPQELEAEAAQLKVKIRFLRECSKARSLLDESITMSSSALSSEEPDLVQSAQRLVEAKQALEEAHKIIVQYSQKSSSPLLKAAFQIMDSIQASLRRQKVHLIGQAKSLWQACVDLTSNSLSVLGDVGTSTTKSSSSSSSSGLVLAYDCLEIFRKDGSSALEDVLRKFIKILYHDVFQPLLQSHKDGNVKMGWTFDETEERSSLSSAGAGIVSKDKGAVRRLEWSNSNGNDSNLWGKEKTSKTTQQISNISAWKDTFDFLQRIIVFIADRVLLNRESLCELVGRRLLGKPDALPSVLNLDALGLESRRLGDDNGLLMEPLIDSLGASCIPTSLKASELGQLGSAAKELQSIIDPFLDCLTSKGLLPQDSGSRLAQFAPSCEQKYVDNRRCVILNEARRLLLENDYHNTVQVGVDVLRNKDEQELGMKDGMAVFKLHKSGISDTAFQVMNLCRKTMDEAVEQQAFPPDSPLALLPANLYRAAREVLDMFRAIIPVSHGYEVKNVPRTAAILHNDCVFFAHHCLTLGLEYKEKFPTPQSDDIRGNLLRQTCVFVDMVPLFRDLADRSMGDMLQLQAQELVEIVGERISFLGEALRSDEIVSEWSDAEAALTASLYHLRRLFQFWKPVLSRDILSSSMWYLADVVFTLFLDQILKAKDISMSACQFVSTLFQKATHEMKDIAGEETSASRIWDRFSAVGKFMDMKLTDIQVALSDGVFRSVSGDELTRLIVATFDDSPKRQNILNILASH